MLISHILLWLEKNYLTKKGVPMKRLFAKLRDMYEKKFKKVSVTIHCGECWGDDD